MIEWLLEADRALAIDPDNAAARRHAAEPATADVADAADPVGPVDPLSSGPMPATRLFGRR